VIKVPERILLDSFQLSQKEKEFVDIHDRDPDIVELADFSKIPVHRIKKIRMMSRPTPTEGALGDAMTGDSDDFSEEATDYIHRDSDRVDRKILEWRTGHGGSDILTPLEIAARLKISPSQVSRRATRLTYKINQMVEDLRSLST
jgi:DNA-directed RNA polymerase specialized sigma subunit